ncbi:MAG: DUF393 domain-containing protein [Myxococcales bacterium]|nr:DUF393 domain-containing protein [Myxococcales bacterium]
MRSRRGRSGHRLRDRQLRHADRAHPLEGRAVIHVLRSLGGVWRLARIFELLPVALVDALNAFVARHRYRWFGRYETCAVPPAHHRAKFLDDGTDRLPTA